MFRPSKVVGKEIHGGINSWLIYLRPPRCGGWNKPEQKQQQAPLPVCPLIQQSQGSFHVTQDFQKPTETSSALCCTPPRFQGLTLFP